MPERESLWSVEETARYLGVPVKTLYQWRWRREGPPARKVGRHLRYAPGDVEAWFRALADKVA
jgi:excisionase family DNA binding protein